MAKCPQCEKDTTVRGRIEQCSCGWWHERHEYGSSPSDRGECRHPMDYCSMPRVCNHLGCVFTGAPAAPPPPDPRDILISTLRAELAAAREEITEWKYAIIAFAAPMAAAYARKCGLPDGHLYPQHYDILAKAGARMVDFTRALEPPR